MNILALTWSFRSLVQAADLCDQASPYAIKAWEQCQEVWHKCEPYKLDVRPQPLCLSPGGHARVKAPPAPCLQGCVGAHVARCSLARAPAAGALQRDPRMKPAGCLLRPTGLGPSVLRAPAGLLRSGAPPLSPLFHPTHPPTPRREMCVRFGRRGGVGGPHQRPGGAGGRFLSTIAAVEAVRMVGFHRTPPPPPRTNRTRRVLHPILIGHAAGRFPPAA